MLKKTITLPASKSQSNRALMIAAYGGFAPDFQNLSGSSDTLVLSHAIQSVRRGVPRIDIADCGTAARFLTPFLACKNGEWLLTGSERMKQRPMAALVEALAQLGADVQYVEKSGFLPLCLKGRNIKGGKARVDMTQSSQFATSLLLMAPMLENGLELSLLGTLSSLPYLDMTLAMMRYFGAEAERKGKTVIVRPKPYRSMDLTVSPDWTAASYWYEIAAFSRRCEIKLQGLSTTPSFGQGDSVIAETMLRLGVKTESLADGLVLTKIPFVKTPLYFDFSCHPDLYPALAATCAGLGVESEFIGMDNLQFKESDRVEAMRMELDRIGSQPLCFCAHNDHRIVMALAPLAMLYGPVSFDHPEVVMKSYPNFWSDTDFLQEYWEIAPIV